MVSKIITIRDRHATTHSSTGGGGNHIKIKGHLQMD